MLKKEIYGTSLSIGKRDFLIVPARPGEIECLRISTRNDTTVTHKIVAKSSCMPSQRDKCKNITNGR